MKYFSPFVDFGLGVVRYPPENLGMEREKIAENKAVAGLWKSANILTNPRQFAAIRKKKGQRRAVDLL